MTEQPSIPGHVYTLGGSETTVHKIVTQIGSPKNPKNPRNFLANGVLFTIVANGFRGIIYSYCRARRYRLIDVEILKIHPLFE